MPACLALSGLCSLPLCNHDAVPNLTLEGALGWILPMIITVLEKGKTWLVWRILKELLHLPGDGKWVVVLGEFVFIT